MQDVPVHIDASIQESPIEGAITIGRLMTEADAFRIPSYYQRDLSWSTAQAEDLWYDLTRALADREAAGGKWSAELLGQVVLTTVARRKSLQHRVRRHRRTAAAGDAHNPALLPA